MTNRQPASADEPKKNLKISIITHEIYPVLSGGAIYVDKIAHELGQLGFEVDVLSQQIGKDSSYQEYKVYYQITRFWTGRKSVGNATFFDHLFFLLFGMPQILWYIKKENVDLNLCLFAIPAGLFGFVSKILTGIPYISIVDGADIPNIKSDMSRFVLILKPLFQAINRYSDAVVLLDGLDDIAIPLLNNKNIHSLSCGMNIIEESAHPCKNNDGVLHMLSIGRLTSRKGFGHIVAACAIAKRTNDKFHLKIIGYGNEAINITKAINENGLQDNITMVGRVEYDQLSEYYLESDCYIFFGDREGQSLALMDAVAYGLPVICSNHPGMTAFVKDGINGITVDHPDVGQLAQAILKMMNDYNKLPEIGLNSKYIAETQSWRNVAIKYKSIINKVLDC